RSNSYACFVELMYLVLSETGRAGVIVPTGIATDDSMKVLFSHFVDRAGVCSLFDFDNRKQIFKGVQGNVTFCLLTLSSCRTDEFLVSAQLQDVGQMQDVDRVYTLRPEDIHRINPNTKT